MEGMVGLCGSLTSPDPFTRHLLNVDLSLLPVSPSLPNSHRFSHGPIDLSASQLVAAYKVGDAESNSRK